MTMRKIIYLVFILFSFQLQAQEFKANVVINAAGISGSNKHIFKTLEHAIEGFINNNQWTDKKFQKHEKIKVDVMLNVKNFNIKSSNITAELYFRSYRPVFNSDYETLLLNLIEHDFEFKYHEFQKLDFNLELYDNNLVSTIAFYLYIALGHDFNSFEENAGSDFFEKAAIIQTNAAQNSIKGWKKENKDNNKGDLIELLQDSHSNNYHKAIYTYHRLGLDLMADNLPVGKNNIISALNYLQKLKKEQNNSEYLIRIFFDAKADEIVQIFSGGPQVNTGFVVSKLRSLAPYYDYRWDEIAKSGNNTRRASGGPPRGRQNIQKEQKNNSVKKSQMREGYPSHKK